MLLQKFEKDLRKFESSVDFGSDYSVYTGTTGVAALYWLLSQVNQEDFMDKIEGKRFMEKKFEKQQVRMQIR